MILLLIQYMFFIKGTYHSPEIKYEVEVTDSLFVSSQDTTLSSPIHLPDREETEEDLIFIPVEHHPEFPGGQEALRKFLIDNIRYPEEAQKEGIEGRVIASAIIERDGSVTNIEVVYRVHPALDKEAMRVLSRMPKWSPGPARGKPIRVKYTFPFNFRLTPDTDEDATIEIGIEKSNQVSCPE